MEVEAYRPQPRVDRLTEVPVVGLLLELRLKPVEVGDTFPEFTIILLLFIRKDAVPPYQGIEHRPVLPSVAGDEPYVGAVHLVHHLTVLADAESLLPLQGVTVMPDVVLEVPADGLAAPLRQSAVRPLGALR